MSHKRTLAGRLGQRAGRAPRPVASRRLTLEQLEPRYLLAADPLFLNFQLNGAPIPAGYEADVGLVFADRGNGFSYGWSSDHTDVSRDRNVNADQRLDTLIHFHQGQTWELEVTNGTYQVTVSIGDPSNPSTHTLNVEGVAYWNAVPLNPDEFLLHTQEVTVVDGRLTLDQGAAVEKATRINYIEVRPTDVTQPSDAVVIVDGVNDGDAAGGNPPAGEGPESAIDNTTNKYLNFKDLGSGLIVTPAAGDSIVTGLRLWTANDVEDRDPAEYILEGSNAGVGGPFTVISQGPLNLPAQRNTPVGQPLPGGFTGFQEIFFSNSTTYSTYRLTFPTLKDAAAANAMQIGEVELLGVVPPIPTNNNSPDAPSINEPEVDGQIVAPEDVHMEAGPFIDADAGDTHTASQWEIWTDSATPERVWSATPAGTVEMVHIHLGDGTFEGSHAGNTAMFGDTDYRLRVRFRDSSGDPLSEWSGWSERTFTTGSLSSPFPLEREDVADTPAPTWEDTTGGAIILPTAATPPSLRMESPTGQLLLEIAGLDGVTNAITNPPPLSDHVAIRLVISGGSSGLALPKTDLTFTDDDGEVQTVLLPAFSVAAGQTLILWISLNGSTYYGNTSPTTPDFSDLARGPDVPWSVAPGFEIDIVSTGYQLPVNIAFVPNAGSDPGDPLYYVNQLYGTISVVTNDGTVSDYATNLLNFNPTGNFPGSGEQGLTGLVVDPLTGDLYVTRVASEIDGNDTAPHHPQVVRFTSTDGGLSAATETVILDMIGESQGQSHQISNITIGPADGKLYVHNGDGFNASTALNLNSFRGKVLRMNLDGTPDVTNPFYDASDGITATDYIFAYGFRNPFGGAWRDADGVHYQAENGPSIDRMTQVLEGVSYGWTGSNNDMFINAIYNWNPSHAPVNMTFIQDSHFGGSSFPTSKQDHLFVTESGPTYATGPQVRGKRIVEFTLDAAGNVIAGPTTLAEYIGTGKATAVGITAGPDGLYFTDLYKDQNFTSPIDPGANVLRIRFVGIPDFTADQTGGGGPLTVNFSDASDVPGASQWFWDFGDGYTSTLQDPTHTYTRAGVYNVTLSVTGDNGVVTTVKPGFVSVGELAAGGVNAVYYDNIDLTGATVSRIDPVVDFNWGTGSPDPAIGVNTFSARWTGFVQPDFSETYTFYTTSDDGVRLWVDDQLIIDNWTDHAPTEDSGAIQLTAGQQVSLRMEYYENGGGATAQLSWESASVAKAIIPSTHLFHFDAAASSPIVARHIFYNNSFFDGNDAGINAADDGAIAPKPFELSDVGLDASQGKTALLPGQTATFANYTSYSRGINGIMVDIENLPATPTLATLDQFFDFKVGNDNNVATWVNPAAAPIAVDVRPGGGLAGSDRITIIWSDNVIQGQWLQVTMLANGQTGLAQPDIHYWGNAPGDTGNSAEDTFVNGFDSGGVRDNPHNFLNRAPREDAYDFNRDSFVNGLDSGVVRDNATNFLNDLALIDLGGVAPLLAPASSQATQPDVVESSVTPANEAAPPAQDDDEPQTVAPQSKVVVIGATQIAEDALQVVAHHPDAPQTSLSGQSSPVALRPRSEPTQTMVVEPAVATRQIIEQGSVEPAPSGRVFDIVVLGHALSRTIEFAPSQPFGRLRETQTPHAVASAPNIVAATPGDRTTDEAVSRSVARPFSTAHDHRDRVWPEFSLEIDELLRAELVEFLAANRILSKRNRLT